MQGVPQMRGSVFLRSMFFENRLPSDLPLCIVEYSLPAAL